MLTSKNIDCYKSHFYIVVASIRRKLLKTADTEERSVHTNLESCNIRHGSLKKQLISKKPFKLSLQFFPNAIVYS